jgi:glycosyltransferase involved in cell wall biosynthesis
MEALQSRSQLPGFRLVTLCGAGGTKHDAMRDSQDILEPMFQQRGIEVCPVDLGRWTLATVPALLREIARLRPDGILMQYPTGAFGHSLGPVFVGLLQRIAPLMVMLHEFIAAHPLRKVAVGALLLRADRVGVTAEREGAALMGRFPWLRDRVRSVPIASNIPGRDWLPTQPPKVIYFGQLRPNKGLEDFFACVDKLMLEVRTAQYEVVGAIVPNLSDYAAFIRDQAYRRGITVTLDLEPDEVSGVLASATVALLPFPDGASFRRGTLFAAAACGVPIVTTIGPDTPAELASFVVGAGSPQEMVCLLRQLLEDEQKLLAAHQRSLLLSSQYGWEKTVDHYVTIFSELARRSQVARPPNVSDHSG